MATSSSWKSSRITALIAKDVRFPTSLNKDGSDAMHVDPDYSCAYVITQISDSEIEGYGLTFTLGRGTEVVVAAIEALKPLLLEESIKEIFTNFGKFWRKLTSESQLRWIGPEKGVTHLAVAAVINSLWDLWARLENKPLWKLLVDLNPEDLVSTIDFRYITDVLKPEDAVKILREKQVDKNHRIKELEGLGYPAYTTQVGWLGYSHEKIATLTQKYLELGFTAFKLKVGQNLQDDIARCRQVRDIIGWKNELMVDANQVWDVPEAISWMQNLAEFKIKWIEEPTSPDDILGHASISQAIRHLGIGVATGEMCCNRVMFKQFMQANALQYCQIDSARLGGVNEILAVYLMAKTLNVPVCPHAGGVGLCEMVQHLQIWDYVAVTGSIENRMIEYVDQQHEHFEDPVLVKNGKYQVPMVPGYSTKFKEETLAKYEYPTGTYWKSLGSQ